MIGFHIHPRVAGVSVETARRFDVLPVANVSDVMSRMAASPACLRPMHDGTRMAGPALTVKTRPGDNLMVHKALSMAQPGDVIVVDAGGDLSNAIIGDADGLMCIPQAQVEEAYAAACAKQKAEERMLAEVTAGTLDTSWIDQRLKALGCGGV